MAGPETKVVRSYRLVFRRRWRIFRIGNWRIPLPGGLELRLIGYWLACLATIDSPGQPESAAIGDNRRVGDLPQIVESAIEAHIHLRPVRIDRAGRRYRILPRQGIEQIARRDA